MKFVISIILTSLLLSACGHKGPLYLPNTAQQEKTPS